MSAHGVDRTGAASGSGAALNPIDQTIIDAKGDLIAGTAADAAARLAVGANDTVLVADSTQTTGLKWSSGSEAFQAIAGGATAETAPAVDDIVMLSDVSLTPDNGRSMTLANLLKVLNVLTADLQPDRLADYVLTYDNSASAVKRAILSQLPLPRSYLAGLGLTNNVGDATNDIDFAVGEARDSTSVANLIAATAMTKQLDVAWAAGTNAGGRMSAAAITNTTYHCYVIRKDSDGTCDFGFDTSASAPTMPSGYTFFRRIGGIVRTGAAIKAFVQNGDDFMWGTPVADFPSGAGSGTAASLTCTVPIGTKVKGYFNVAVSGSAAGAQSTYLSDLATVDLAPSQVAAPGAHVSESSPTANEINGNYAGGVWTNTAGQIRHRELNTNNVMIATLGYSDYRGKFD